MPIPISLYLVVKDKIKPATRRNREIGNSMSFIHERFVRRQIKKRPKNKAIIKIAVITILEICIGII